MNKINNKTFSVLFLSVFALFLASALISSLFLLKELKNDNYEIPSLENRVNLEGVLEPGTIGEIENDDSQKNLLPPAVFNTAGVVVAIKNDRLIVAGNGSNFNDKIPRELNVVFIGDTIVFISSDQKVKYRGVDGLRNMAVGKEILIEGAENIRGKTEFAAGTINVLQ